MKARQIADAARKAVAYLSIFTAVSILIGALIAAAAAALGGRHRDEDWRAPVEKLITYKRGVITVCARESPCDRFRHATMMDFRNGTRVREALRAAYRAQNSITNLQFGGLGRT